MMAGEPDDGPVMVIQAWEDPFKSTMRSWE
jgi:hypothetical protein